MFKTIVAAAAMLLVLACFSTVAAKDSAGLVSGNLTTADAAGNGVGYFGGYVGFGDNAAAVFGTFTYGLAQYTDIRFKLGFSDADVPNSDPEIFLGVDFKYEIMDYYDTLHSNPFDLAAGAFMEYVAYENTPVFQLGGNLIGSIPYRFNSGHKIVPYARLNIRMERVSNDQTDESDTDFQGGLNVGTKFEVNRDFHLYGEFQIDGNAGIFLGLDVRVF